MNKPTIIGVTAGIAAIGLSIPVYAAMSTPTTPANAPARSVVSDDSVTTTPSSLPSSTEPTVTSPASIPAVSVPENAEDTTENSTPTSVEDVSGPCDEAEHATDDRCTGTGTDDSSGRDGSGHGEDDGSSHRGHGGGNDG